MTPQFRAVIGYSLIAGFITVAIRLLTDVQLNSGPYDFITSQTGLSHSRMVLIDTTLLLFVGNPLLVRLALSRMHLFEYMHWMKNEAGEELFHKECGLLSLCGIATALVGFVYLLPICVVAYLCYMAPTLILLMWLMLNCIIDLEERFESLRRNCVMIRFLFPLRSELLK